MDLEQHQQFWRVGLRYYQQIEEFNITKEDFEVWIESLQEPMKSDFRTKGFEASRNTLNFQRFCLESRDRGLDEFMKANLSAADYHQFLLESRGS